MTIMLSLPAHSPARLSLSAQVAGELKATFGDAAVLCVQDDEAQNPGTPAPHAHDNCPLCQFQAHALGLQVPDLAVLPHEFAPSGDTPIASTELAPQPSRWPSTSQPRGPPQLV